MLFYVTPHSHKKRFQTNIVVKKIFSENGKVSLVIFFSNPLCEKRKQRQYLLLGYKHNGAIEDNEEEKLAQPFQQPAALQEKCNHYPERYCSLSC